MNMKPKSKSMTIALVQLDDELGEGMRARTYVLLDRNGRVEHIIRSHPSGMGAASAYKAMRLRGYRISDADWASKARRAFLNNPVAVAECASADVTGGQFV